MILLPIIIVVSTGIFALVVEMFWPRKSNNAQVGLCLVGLVGALVSLIAQLSKPDALTFADMVLRDRTASVMQIVLVLACFLAILFSEPYLREKRIPFGEFYPLAIWSTAGAMVMVSTTNLLMFFIGLEVLSISLYVLAGLSRQESKSQESALKYFLLGAFASAFFLYGCAFVYGATGSIDISAIHTVWNNGDQTAHNLILFGLGFLFVGLAFKSAFVPFHQWTPDVYQGAPTNATALMAAISKLAAIGVLVRVLDAATGSQAIWMPLFFWIAILTMTVGNVMAILQKDIKRILGYSSIANAGYVLVAVLAHYKNSEQVSTGSIVFFLLSYTLMTVGAFAVISLVAKRGTERTSLKDLNGLYQRAPFAAVALVIFLASLIGVPPTGGFFAKLFIFRDALTAGLTPLAVLLAVNSVISVYYYLGIALAAFVNDEDAERNRSARLSAGVVSTCAICAVGIFAVMFFVTPIMEYMAGR